MQALLALLLLQQSRVQARTDANGDLVLLAEQDRGLWDRQLIAEGVQLAEQSLSGPRFGCYALQAAIGLPTRPTGRKSVLCMMCCCG